MSTHRWTGRKPHRRSEGIREGGRVIGFHRVEIKPGEAFSPTDNELASFRDLLEPIGETLKFWPDSQGNKLTEVNTESDVVVAELSYAVHDRGGNWYDVIEVGSGNRQNEGALRKSEADVLCESMNARAE